MFYTSIKSTLTNKKEIQMKYLSFAIEDDFHQKLKEYCVKNKISMRDLIENLLVKAFEKKEKA